MAVVGDAGTGRGAAVAAALLAAAASCADEQRRKTAAVEALLARGMLANVIRVESFGFAATGDETTAGRVIFYVRGATPAQRTFDARSLGVAGCAAVFIDLDDDADCCCLAAEIGELQAVYGATPFVIYPRSG